MAVRSGVPQADGELTHLRLRGPLTASTAPRLRHLLDAEASTPDPHRLLIDLESVSAVDAVGIAVLLNGQRALGESPAGEVFLRPNATVTRALKQSGTIHVFRLWLSAAPDAAPFVELA